MLGHLPLRYQVAIWFVGLLTSAGVGAWLAWSTSGPLLWTSGAAIGALLGIVVVAGFLHTIGTEPGPSSAEVPARR